MNRRALLSAAAIAALPPSLARAQGAGTMRRVAVLISAAELDSEGRTRKDGLTQGLRELGWVDGLNIRLDVRYAAGSSQRMRDITAEFVAAVPDVIAVNSTPALAEIHKATKTIPVVVMLAVDPVTLGYIGSLARPGGNITGFIYFDAGLIGKWLQLLKEVMPAVSHATLLHNPANTPFYPRLVKSIEGMPGLPKVELRIAPISKAADYDRAISEVAREPGGSLIVPSDPFNLDNRAAIVAAALRSHLPLASVYAAFTKAGGLISYGPDTSDIYRRSAGYIDRILKGSKPADLPVQAPDKYDFLINMGTAHNLGLTVSPTLLAQADEVIE